jgi:hypothetical protein
MKWRVKSASGVKTPGAFLFSSSSSSLRRPLEANHFCMSGTWIDPDLLPGVRPQSYANHYARHRAPNHSRSMWPREDGPFALMSLSSYLVFCSVTASAHCFAAVVSPRLVASLANSSATTAKYSAPSWRLAQVSAPFRSTRNQAAVKARS